MTTLTDFNVIDTRKVDEKITVHNGVREVTTETHDRRTVVMLPGHPGMPEKMTKDISSWRQPDATVDFHIDKVVLEWTPNTRYSFEPEPVGPVKAFKRWRVEIIGRQILKSGLVGIKERTVCFYYTQAEADDMEKKLPGWRNRSSSEDVMPEWLADIAVVYDPDGYAHPFGIEPVGNV